MVYKNAPLEQTNEAYDGSEDRTRFVIWRLSILG